MTTLAASFPVGFSFFLKVARSFITAWMISKFGQIRPWTMGLAALGVLKIPIEL